MELVDAVMRKTERYVSRVSFEKGMARNIAIAPMTLQHLRGMGVTPQSEARLQFFFYTNADVKAIALSTELMKRKYLVEQGIAAARKNEKVVIGWTTRMRMQDHVVLDWVRDMCQLGFAHDCKFDGWGTNSRS